LFSQPYFFIYKKTVYKKLDKKQWIVIK